MSSSSTPPHVPRSAASRNGSVSHAEHRPAPSLPEPPAQFAPLLLAARRVQGVFPIGVKFDAGSVAAALRTQSGSIYTGICLDLACGIGFCAEHAAVAEMLKFRETRVEAIVAVSRRGVLAPCGRCRELLAQVDPGNLDCQILLPSFRVVRLRELLPEHWLDTLSAGSKAPSV